MKFLDFFAGIGGFRLGMEMAGHECVGHCEWDKYANASYIAMHNPKGDEWYGADIRNVRANELPRADIWCFGFPCQDISVAGKQLGFDGKRSSLFFTVTRLIRDSREEDKPTTLFIENVKNLLGVNGGIDFLKLLVELDEIGYDAEWQVLNSKNFGVPQNRERVFIIGHFRGRSGREVFPIETTDGVFGNGIKRIAHSKYFRRVLQTFDVNGSCEALDTMQGGNRQPCVLISEPKLVGGVGEKNFGSQYRQGNRVYDAEAIAMCLNAQPVGNTGGNSYLYKVGDRIRKLTPKECFRLQGFPDTYFEKAAAVNSNSQLYKQAGNGVTVNVIYEIAKKLAN